MGKPALRAPHTTPQTIVYETTVYPPLFSYECNVEGCFIGSGRRHEIGEIEKAARHHNRVAHLTP